MWMSIRCRFCDHSSYRNTLRKAGAGSDPYAVFARVLASGNPPDDWPALLAEVQVPDAERRLGVATGKSSESDRDRPPPSAA